MKLRRPCEHGRYEEHQAPSGGYSKHPHYSPDWTTCPGGVFLPDDTLVIEKVDGEWPKWAKAAIHEWHVLVQMDVVEHPASVLLDALSIRDAK